MGWRASHWAKTVKTGSPTNKAVLMALAEETDKWGFAWSGEKAIAEYAEISERQVRRVTRILAEQGRIAIFQAREKDGRLRNLYRLNFNARPKDRMPEGHPSQSGRYELKWGVSIDNPDFKLPAVKLSGGEGAEMAESGGLEQTGEREAPEDKLSGGRHRTPGVEPPDTEGQATGHQMSGIPVTEPVTEPSAPDGAGDPGGAAPPGAGDGMEPDRPANALWKEKQAKLERSIGQAAFRSWFRHVIPHEDRPDLYVLAAPSAFTRDWIRSNYIHQLRRVLGKEVVIEVMQFAVNAKRAAEAQEREAGRAKGGRR